MGKGGKNVLAGNVEKSVCRFHSIQHFADALQYVLLGVRHHHSSAPEPAVTGPPFRHAHRARGQGLLRLPLDEVRQDHVEAVVHLKGERVVHHSVHDALVQLGGHFVSLAAQLGSHPPDFIAVKVDGGHPLGVAAVAHLVALAVETVSSCLIGKFI